MMFPGVMVIDLDPDRLRVPINIDKIKKQNF